MTLGFIAKNAVTGVALAMDAFSVSLANGLNEPCMKKKKMLGVALCFSFFQFLMPLLGWFCVHSAAEAFEVIKPYIPWVAFLLLFIIGAKSIAEGLGHEGDEVLCRSLSWSALMVQGVATSIDALSVGFVNVDYDLPQALAASLIIAVVTFGLCLPGVAVGKRFGTKISGKASVLGGVILIGIGLKICIESLIA